MFTGVAGLTGGMIHGHAEERDAEKYVKVKVRLAERMSIGGSKHKRAPLV